MWVPFNLHELIVTSLFPLLLAKVPSNRCRNCRDVHISIILCLFLFYRVKFREQLLQEKLQSKKLEEEHERQLEVEKEERLEKLRQQVCQIVIPM